MNKTILLTGATGFLGSHILRRLINDNYNVVILVRETSDNWRIKDFNGFSIFVLNPTGSNIENVFDLYKIDMIIHLATEYGRNLPYSSIIESNVIFPIKLIEFGIKNKVQLFVNTDSYFGKFKNHSYLAQYVESKQIINNYTKSLLDIKVINLRLEHIYGEYDSDNKFITGVMNKMLSNENVIELTEGLQKRDFIYVKDVVDAYLIIINNQHLINNFTEFEVGTGNSITVKEFVMKMQIACGSKSELLFGALDTRANEIQDSKADSTKLISLGWRPKFVPETALKKIINIVKDKYSN